MAKEIERKFLVDPSQIPELGKPVNITQGYIVITEDYTVRVRQTCDKSWLTIKSSQPGLSRTEFEWIVPDDDATELLSNACANRIIKKRRYTLEVHGAEWTLDFFDTPFQGIVLAEIELRHEHDEVAMPVWVTEEVTNARKYLNSELALSASTKATRNV